MSPLAISTVLSAGIAIGIIFYSYHQGTKVCDTKYLKEQIVSLNSAVSRFKALAEFNNKIAGEATKQAKIDADKADQLREYIDAQSKTNTCPDGFISDEFLRRLEKL